MHEEAREEGRRGECVKGASTAPRNNELVKLLVPES
jgi:hypothetical protein